MWKDKPFVAKFYVSYWYGLPTPLKLWPYYYYRYYYYHGQFLPAKYGEPRCRGSSAIIPSLSARLTSNAWFWLGVSQCDQPGPAFPNVQ